jgi:vacuolar-type H+-ATPase subunit I/STV1
MDQLAIFDYSNLPGETAGDVRAATERIKLRMKRTAEDIVAIGQDLLEVKQVLGHGRFLEWIEFEFEMKERTAQNFMRVAETFGGKSAKFADLKPSVLYALAAPSTPEPVREQVIEKATNGERVSVKEVEELKRRCKAAEEARRAAEVKTKQAEMVLRSANDKNLELETELSSLGQQAKSLEQLVNELKGRQQERIEVERIVEVVPGGYSSLEEAITVKQGELQAVNRQIDSMKKRIRASEEHQKRIEQSFSQCDSIKSKISKISVLQSHFADAIGGLAAIVPDFDAIPQVADTAMVQKAIEDHRREVGALYDQIIFAERMLADTKIVIEQKFLRNDLSDSGKLTHIDVEARQTEYN